MKFLRIAAAMLMAVAACAGCTDADKASEQPALGDGPLVAGEGHGTLCMPIAATLHDVSFGNTKIRNSGSKDATLTAVTPVNPKNLRIAELVIVKSEASSFGTSLSWPPASVARNEPDRAEQWATRQPAIGHLIAPFDGSNYNLVAHLIKDDGASEMSFEALRIEYTVDGKSYFANNDVTLDLKSRCL